MSSIKFTFTPTDCKGVQKFSRMTVSTASPTSTRKSNPQLVYVYVGSNASIADSSELPRMSFHFNISPEQLVLLGTQPHDLSFPSKHWHRQVILVQTCANINSTAEPGKTAPQSMPLSVILTDPHEFQPCTQPWSQSAKMSHDAGILDKFCRHISHWKSILKSVTCHVTSYDQAENKFKSRIRVSSSVAAIKSHLTIWCLKTIRQSPIPWITSPSSKLLFKEKLSGFLYHFGFWYQPARAVEALVHVFSRLFEKSEGRWKHSFNFQIRVLKIKPWKISLKQTLISASSDSFGTSADASCHQLPCRGQVLTRGDGGMVSQNVGIPMATMRSRRWVIPFTGPEFFFSKKQETCQNCQTRVNWKKYEKMKSSY